MDIIIQPFDEETYAITLLTEEARQWAQDHVNMDSIMIYKGKIIFPKSMIEIFNYSVFQYDLLVDRIDESVTTNLEIENQQLDI